MVRVFAKVESLDAVNPAFPPSQVLAPPRQNTPPNGEPRLKPRALGSTRAFNRLPDPGEVGFYGPAVLGPMGFPGEGGYREDIAGNQFIIGVMQHFVSPRLPEVDSTNAICEAHIDEEDPGTPTTI